eukprot:SAG22_NODE_371_length_11566_cov_5.447458_6_plen_95_part_00
MRCIRFSAGSVIAPCLDHTQQYNVFGSKPATEPAMVLGCGPYFALKQAVYAARNDAGLAGWFELPLPATPARTQPLCGVSAATLAASLVGVDHR